MFNDGTAVFALAIAAPPGYNDTYSQTFATTPGTTYTYSFTFFDPVGQDGGLSGLLVTTTASIPEPWTWAMMLLGFAGLGFAGYRTRGLTRWPERPADGRQARFLM
jgi:hypothetical protein